MNGGKLSSVQVLRGVAVILVLMFHLTEAQHRYAGSSWSGSLSALGNAGVDLFFVISGFVVVGVARQLPRRSGADMFGFLYDRAARIYPIYWFYSVLLIVPFLINPSYVNTMSRLSGVSDFVHSFLLLPNRTSPILLVGWTLVYEVYFYVVVGAILYSGASINAALALWGAVVVGLGAMLEPGVHPVTDLLSSPLALEFIAGGFASAWPLRSMRPAAAWALLATPVVGAALMCIFWVLPRTDIGLWFRVLAYGSLGLALLCASVALEGALRQVPHRWLASVGDASYSIYLTHTLILSGLGRILMQRDQWHLATAALTLVAACLIAGFLSYRYLERPMLSFARGAKSTVLRSVPA